MKKSCLFCAVGTWVFVLGLFSSFANAALIALHDGATDPTTEGWVFQSNLPSGISIGPVINDLGTGIDAWAVDDNSLSANGRYSSAISDEQVMKATTLGWMLSTRLRSVQIPDPDSTLQTRDVTDDGSPGIAFRDGTRSWSLHFETTATDDLNVYLMTDVAVPGSRDGIPVPIAGGAGSYHLYDIVYDPLDGNADFFVDGALTFSDWMGAPLALQGLYFGAGTTPALGHGNFNLVRFQVVPIPPAAWLFGSGLLGLVGVARRKAA
jgi:hypothetical protein